MRRFLAGTFLLLTLLPVARASAETKGEVESIGFGSLYRPNCYTPMRVRVQADQSGTYQIRVVQDDLDADQPHFTQTVSLTGQDEAKGADQRFWLYFIPQPTDGGLPDTTKGYGLRELQQTLKVFLYDESGTKQLAQLPVTQTIQNLEGAQNGPVSATRGSRLILAVSDGAAQPVWRDYQQALGTTEDVVFVTLRATDLPEDVRGYEAVDGIVWLNAPAPDPTRPADERRHRALREYVRGGGHLVICQPPQKDATVAWDDLMPVAVAEVAPREDLLPLRRIATESLPPPAPAEDGVLRGPGIDDWSIPKGPFMFARAQLKRGAIAEEFLKWKPDGSDATPYLARVGHGAGCVSWVAHDLSDPAITTRAKSGWPFVWDRVLDFRNDITLIDNRTTDEQKKPYAPGAATDTGAALLAGMNLTGKSRGLVSIAVVFFIAYWVVAGPGIYLYLVTKSRPQLSWFLFAGSALAATFFTVLVVRLVVRGAPEAAHVTLVRSAPDAPALSLSRFGLYIPRDGDQQITLPDVAPNAVSYVTAFPEHPAHVQGDIDFPAHMVYVVPTRDAAAGAEEPAGVTVPFRSTLKRFQARRAGPVAGGIEGNPKLRESELGYNLEGVLLNASGQRLKNVYFVYNRPPRSMAEQDGIVGEDFVLYLPAWEKSQSIDIAAEFDKVKAIGTRTEAGNFYGYPEQGFKLKGPMGRPGQDFGWSRYWYSSLRNNSVANATLTDLNERVPKSIPMLSLFGRLPPMKNFNQRGDRVELLRRGGRSHDVSAAVTAGRLVVIAEADGDQPLPFPLDVEGDKVAAKGVVIFQDVLPIDRIPIPPPPAATTTPTTTSPTAVPAAPASPSPAAPVRRPLPEQ